MNQDIISVDEQAVVTRTTVERIGSFATDHVVVADATADDVVTIAAVQAIVADAAANNRIVALSTRHDDATGGNIGTIKCATVFHLAGIDRFNVVVGQIKRPNLAGTIDGHAIDTRTSVERRVLLDIEIGDVVVAGTTEEAI